MRKKYLVAILGLILAGSVIAYAISARHGNIGRENQTILLENYTTNHARVIGEYNLETGEGVLRCFSSGYILFTGTASEEEITTKLYDLNRMILLKEYMYSTEGNWEHYLDKAIEEGGSVFFSRRIGSIFDPLSRITSIYGPGINQLLYAGILSEEEVRNILNYWLEIYSMAENMSFFLERQ